MSSSKNSAPLSALVFDAYGTLFDVHSVVRLCEELWPGKGEQLSRLWRSKQLEYTWLRSLMQRYEDFARITEDGLRHACAALELPLNDSQRARLMGAYLQLALFPEVKGALKQLDALPLAILSNGSPAMLKAVVANVGLGSTFRAVISVDTLKIFKPAPQVYSLAVEELGVPEQSIGFVSSNGWDVCGAASYGFRTFWINRSGATREELGVRPDHVIRGLDELPALVASA